jgi:DNA primase
VFRLREAIAEIKARTDCRELAEELGLPRKWSSYLCPFHGDHKPSLSVWPDGYKCWGCGAKGSAFDLYMAVKTDVGFLDALDHLARRCGVILPRSARRRSTHARTTPPQQPLPQPAPRRADDSPAIDPDRRIAIYTAFAQAGRLQENYAPHAPALDYLRRRGISAATAIGAGLSYVADYRRATAWLREQATLEELQVAGLFNVKEDGKSNLKLFKHRLLIPYWIDGEVVAIQARNINWRSKELDGPKELTLSPVAIPFNSDTLLDRQEQVYVCEGAIDTLSLLELGFTAVGIPSARNFRLEWVELFADVGEVVLALDNDAAGDEGAAAIAGHFGQAGREVTRLELPEGINDINEFLVARA